LHHGAQAIDLFDSKSFMARGVPGWFLIPLGVICHAHIACNMHLRQALPNGISYIAAVFA
jgi:hypothetical protein